MGYSYRNNGAITDFTPDNTDTTLYLQGDHTMEEIVDMAEQHFGARFSFFDAIITSETIHTSCLTYDLHDPSDWTNYIVITVE